MDTEEFFSWQSKLANHNTIYQAELWALYNAILWIHKNYLDGNFNILTDSKSSVLAIRKFHQRSQVVQLIQRLLKFLESSKINIHIAWTRAHVGTYGNERADSLAKDATLSLQSLNTVKIPISFLKSTFHENLINSWQNYWSTEETGRRTFSFLPEVSQQRIIFHNAIVAFLTNHGPFPAYKFRFHLGGAQTPNCICGTFGDADHYYFSCPLTKQWHLKPFPPGFSSAYYDKILKNKLLQNKFQSIYSWLFAQGDDLVATNL